MDGRNEVKRPSDVYDVAGWNAYWAANPLKLRGVGADAADGEAGTGGEGEEGAAGTSDAADDIPQGVPELVELVKTLRAEKAAADDEKAKLLKDTMKNKGKAKDASAAAEAASARLAAVESQIKDLLGPDVSLDDLQEHVKARKAAETANLEKAGEFGKVKEQMIAAHTAEVTALKTSYEAAIAEKTALLESADKEIRRLLVSNSFAASKLVNDELTLTASKAERLFGDHFKVEVGENGQREVRAYIGDKPIVDSAGKYIGFEDALKAIVEADPDKNTLYRAKAKPGAGSGTDASEGAGKIQGERPRGVAAIQAGLSGLKK